MAVKIHWIKKCPVKEGTLVEGFPGIGLVGTISASYIVEKLKMELVGYITSREFPPISAIHNYLPIPPARIYASKKHKLIVLLSEFVVPLPAIYELSDAIWDFVHKCKVKRIISLGGIAVKNEQGQVFSITTDRKLVKKLEKSGEITIIKDGATTGVTGVLLARGAMEKFPVVSFLAQAHGAYMDPKASAMVLNVLKKHLGLKFNTTELERESQLIEQKMHELLKKAKDANVQYTKTAKQHSPDWSMYG